MRPAPQGPRGKGGPVMGHRPTNDTVQYYKNNNNNNNYNNTSDPFLRGEPVGYFGAGPFFNVERACEVREFKPCKMIKVKIDCPNGNATCFSFYSIPLFDELQFQIYYYGSFFSNCENRIWGEGALIPNPFSDIRGKLQFEGF